MGIEYTDIQAKLKELDERHRLAELGGGENASSANTMPESLRPGNV